MGSLGTRAHYVDYHLNGKGEPIAGATVYVYDQHTTDLIGEDLYQYDSDGVAPATVLSNPLTTGTDGKYEFYLAAAARVDLKIVTPGGLLQDVTRTVDVTRTPNDNGLAATILDAKGDIIAATAADTASRLAVGANDTVLTADSAQATGLKWAAPAAAAPTNADYLVGTANGTLSAEIVVGTTPGGELGGTWASPTVDTTHSGSSHADVQAAAEAASIAKTIVDAKGDLIVATAADTVARVAIGTNDHVLTAASGETAGLKWAALPSSGAMTQIAHSALGSNTTNIDFTSIPATYNHLMIVIQARGTNANNIRDFFIQFNSDTNGNYDYIGLYVESAGTVAAFTQTSAQTAIHCGYLVSAGAGANRAGIARLLIPNYKGTTYYKQVTTEVYGPALTSATNVRRSDHAGIWLSTAAISSIRLYMGAGDWATGSMLTLYGLT